MENRISEKAHESYLSTTEKEKNNKQEINTILSSSIYFSLQLLDSEQAYEVSESKKSHS